MGDENERQQEDTTGSMNLAVADDTGSALEGAAVLARDPEALHTSQYGLFVWNAAR